MTPQELKYSILQLAIQGKLVEQRPEEGTGEELYQQIQEKKQKLIKDRKIKKGKSLPEITEDEIPFDIPDSWKWVRWGEIVNIVSARRVHQSDWKNEGIPFYRAREIAKLSADGYVDNDLFISQELYNDFSKSGVPSEGDLMVTAVGTLGKTYIVKKTDHFYYKDASVICFENYAHISPEYLKYMMESELMRNQIRGNSSGTTVATLTMVRMVEYLMPLPPLAEQKRIVAKIEELLPYIDRYEKAWNRLEDLNKRFPVDMQKSILQMAIQGKLVEQRPEEGTAEELYKQIQAEKKELIKAGKIKKEKPLPEITEDEIPFDIPESWKWVRMGNFAQLVTKGSSPRWQGIQYVEEGLLFVTSENVGINSLILENKKYVEERFNELSPRSQLSKGDLLTNIVGASIGRTAVYNLDEPANINQAVCLIRLVNSDLLQYILMYMNSATAYNIMMSDKVDTARANISLTNISNFIIPIPPLAEQKRIIAKLAEILPLCRNLK